MKKYVVLLVVLPFVGFIAGSLVTNTFENRYIPGNNDISVNAADLPYDNTVKTGTIKEFDLSASTATIQLNDNDRFETWAYNGQVPGPELRVEKGDTVRINFTNNLLVDTTIHFHGIRVPNKMDGVPDVTQTPIQSGETFTYEFVAHDAGTFWYHPHVRGNEQVERGLYGTIVVEDPNEPSYSQDKVIVKDDWRILANGKLDENFNNMHDIGHDGRWGNVITINGYVLPEMNISSNERVRYRFVNTSNARVYTLDFGELNAHAIAVDGVLVRDTFDPNGFELAPGNRLDVDITAPDSNETFVIKDRFAGFENDLFVVHVGEERVDLQNFELPQAEKYPDMNISNYIVDREYALDQGGMGMMHNIVATINGQAYPNYQESSLSKNEFQVIRFSNPSARIHPMHLHGQFFKVIARNGVSVDEPFMRDTVLVHGFETVDVGIVPIDGGDWALHCHILEHAEAGMMTVVEVK